MKDFVLAALPWVLCGVAVAIICSRMGRREEKKSGKVDQRIAIGLALGLMFGSALNSIGLWQNHGMGLALGPLWGMALALLFDNKKSTDEE